MGPRAGLAEIALPETQPGSSIMPGKVNPVLPEATLMVCARVVGNDATIAWSGAAGSFELNVMMPVMAHNLVFGLSLLANACRVFEERCIRGITADADIETSRHEGAGLEAFLDEQKRRYAPQLDAYAAAFERARLGLYFPLLRGWREW